MGQRGAGVGQERPDSPVNERKQKKSNSSTQNKSSNRDVTFTATNQNAASSNNQKTSVSTNQSDSISTNQNGAISTSQITAKSNGTHPVKTETTDVTTGLENPQNGADRRKTQLGPTNYTPLGCLIVAIVTNRRSKMATLAKRATHQSNSRHASSLGFARSREA